MNYLNKMIKVVAKELDVCKEDINVVWFSKTLQNAKMICIIIKPDNDMYELSYNGDKKEYYLDKYVKISNKVIDD